MASPAQRAHPVVLSVTNRRDGRFWCLQFPYNRTRIAIVKGHGARWSHTLTAWMLPHDWFSHEQIVSLMPEGTVWRNCIRLHQERHHMSSDFLLVH